LFDSSRPVKTPTAGEHEPLRYSLPRQTNYGTKHDNLDDKSFDNIGRVRNLRSIRSHNSMMERSSLNLNNDTLN
jgi:hypothetical protein